MLPLVAPDLFAGFEHLRSFSYSPRLIFAA
jgi:hypothetical protein